MTTRSVPFRRDDLFWGVATIDIALTQLIAEMARIQPGPAAATRSSSAERAGSSPSRIARKS